MEVEKSDNADKADPLPTSLLEEITKLKEEKLKLTENFDVQRAKFKELFLQKEEEVTKTNMENVHLMERIEKLNQELNDAKSQLVLAGLKLESDLEVEKRKAQEEIATWQQIVHETVEESSTTKNYHDAEIRRLQQAIQTLERENLALKSNTSLNSSQEGTSLAPSVMLTAVTKTLARKLGADTFTSQDSLEDSMRKAQEDAEVLRGLVIPLEEEIKALKDKLRTTDEQLQKCIQCRHLVNQNNTSFFTEPDSANGSQNADSSSTTAACDMCSNYEAQLVREQQVTSKLQNKLALAEKALERQKEDLLKEIGFRKDMEEKWNAKKEEHKLQIQELNQKTQAVEKDLLDLKRQYHGMHDDFTKKLELVCLQREQIHTELYRLQRENENLVGKHSTHSRQMQSEVINLPNTVEELQELALKYLEDLIIAKTGKEAAQENEAILEGELIAMREQLVFEQQSKESLKNDSIAKINSLKSEIEELQKEKEHSRLIKEKYQKLENANIELQEKYNELIATKTTLEEKVNELRSRITSLQQELDVSEDVQKDFVKLSQSLQVQLEKIRESDMQVRWQHEEDVDECPTCHTPLQGSKRKQHCRHCGTIFCANCLSHVVPSGPKQRPSRVCGVCYTLLVKSSAPYFSNAAPQSPT